MPQIEVRTYPPSLQEVIEYWGGGATSGLGLCWLDIGRRGLCQTYRACVLFVRRYIQANGTNGGAMAKAAGRLR